MKKVSIFISLLIFLSEIANCQIKKIDIDKINQLTKALKTKAISKLYKEGGDTSKHSCIKIFSLIYGSFDLTENNNNKLDFDTSNLGVVVFDRRNYTPKFFLFSDSLLKHITIPKYNQNFVFNLNDSNTCYVYSDILINEGFVGQEIRLNYFINNNTTKDLFLDYDGKYYNSFELLVDSKFGSYNKFIELIKYSDFKNKLFKEYNSCTDSCTLEGVCKIVAKSWPLKYKYFPHEKEKLIKAYVDLIEDALQINSFQKKLIFNNINTLITQFKKINLNKVFNKASISLSNYSSYSNHFLENYDLHSCLEPVLTAAEIKLFEKYFDLFSPHKGGFLSKAESCIYIHCGYDSKKAEKKIMEIVKKSMEQY